MRVTRKLFAAGLAALLLAGGAAAQVDLSRYVAVGDSLTAGYASGGLAQLYQDDSYPAILAGQFGISGFQQPTVSNPGIAAVLELKQLLVAGGQIIPVIAPKSGQGQPTNATYQGIYGNLGVPGANTNDLLTKTGDVTRLLAGTSTSATVMYDIVLRFPVIPGTQIPGTAVNQAIGAQGTIYTVWAGNNDVLGAALYAFAIDGVTLTPVAAFQQQYTTLLGAIRLQRPNAAIVVATIPDVGVIPFTTTVAPYIFTPQGQQVFLQGENGPLTANDRVTLPASALIQQGYGIPGTGLLLPEGSFDPATMTPTQGYILRAAELGAIATRVNELNAVIRAVASSVGAAVFDFNAFFAQVAANGYRVGGIELSVDFLTGGLISYDGVHPQTLGYAVIANEFVKTINEAFGAEVPLVNLRPYLIAGAATTSVVAGQAIFTPEAHRQLLRTLFPGLKQASPTLIRPVQRRLNSPGRQPGGWITNP
jgi:lysophospholipase L1-like esterase